MPDVLEIRGLSKRFGGITVADGIDLTLGAGRILGLIGPNGAGKTTLFNLVTGVIRPDAGRVQLDGVPLDGRPVAERARMGLSRTWQNLRLFPSLSVLDNLMMGPRHYPGSSLVKLIARRRDVRAAERATRAKAEDILERMDVAALAGHPVAGLPYGQQKLISVGRALMNDARCLLLDEPMAGVEGAAYATMQRMVRSVAETGTAVCIVEHNIAFVRDLCDEGVFLFGGSVMARGGVEDLIADPQLTELYFGT